MCLTKTTVSSYGIMPFTVTVIPFMTIKVFLTNLSIQAFVCLFFKGVKTVWQVWIWATSPGFTSELKQRNVGRQTNHSCKSSALISSNLISVLTSNCKYWLTYKILYLHLQITFQHEKSWIFLIIEHLHPLKRSTSWLVEDSLVTKIPFISPLCGLTGPKIVSYLNIRELFSSLIKVCLCVYNVVYSSRRYFGSRLKFHFPDVTKTGRETKQNGLYVSAYQRAPWRGLWRNNGYKPSSETAGMLFEMWI